MRVLPYKHLLDTQEAINLFHGVMIFRENGNIEFCVIGDNVPRHRVVGVDHTVKSEKHNTGSEFRVLSRQCPRRDFQQHWIPHQNENSRNVIVFARKHTSYRVF